MTGDTVNLAARVMGRSEHGQVLATRAVLERTRNPFETEALTPFMVKGKSEPVEASAVLDAKELGTRDGGGEDEDRDSSFLGRDRELSLVMSCAEAAANGSGSLVDIQGASGIGKSRLVSEAASRWSLETLKVVCDDYESTTPYVPFRRILRQLFGFGTGTTDQTAEPVLRRAVRELAPQMEPFLPLLADLVGVQVPTTRQVEELEIRFRRTRLADLVVSLLTSFVSEPTAVVIEDAHAMDEASDSLLGRISAEVSGLPLLVVCTRNPDRATIAAGDAGHVVIDLEPLGRDAAVALASSENATALAPSELATIVERAGGNPLFLRELIRSAAVAGGTDVLPESIESLLVGQIDRLPPLERQMLRAAAVLGVRFDPELVPNLLDEQTQIQDAAWDRLSDFVSPASNTWAFSHALLRDAAYEGLSYKRRQELHARAGGAIEERTDQPDEAAELLSLHWLHANRYDRAWHYARVAGDRARSLWANAEASTFYDRAFEASRHLDLPRDEVRSVTEALGDSYELNARYEQARTVYANTRRLCDSDVDRGTVAPEDGRPLRARGPLLPGSVLLQPGTPAPFGAEAQGSNREIRAQPRVRGHQVPPGALPGMRRVRYRGRSGSEAGASQFGARPRALPPTRDVRLPRRPRRRARLPVARDLRADRGSRRAGERLEQSRHRGLLPGSVGRRPLLLRAQPRSAPAIR